MKQTMLLCGLVLLALSVLSVTGMERPEPREVQCSGPFEAGICPLNFKPVCGTDGKTYSNECRLCHHNKINKENVKILHDNKCSDEAGCLSNC